MSIFYYSTDTNKLETFEHKMSTSPLEFRKIEEKFLKDIGSAQKIIGVFRYYAYGQVNVAALENFILDRRNFYLIVTDIYPFGKTPGFITKQNFFEETQKSIKNFKNSSTLGESNYAFRTISTGIFKTISRDYKLDLPSGLNAEFEKFKTDKADADAAALKKQKADEEALNKTQEENAAAAAALKKQEEDSAAAAALKKQEEDSAAALKKTLEKHTEAAPAITAKSNVSNEGAPKKLNTSAFSGLSNLFGKTMVQTEKFVGYAEKQDEFLCGKHAINHILQEEKIVKVVGKGAVINKNTQETMPDNTEETDPVAQLNLVNYCRILEQLEQTDTGLTPEPMCSSNYDNIRFNGVYYLLQTLLSYSVYTTNNPKEIGEFIKTNLQKYKCLGIIINLGAYHYTAITKFYIEGNYTYIDSQHVDNIISDSNIESFMTKISTEVNKSVAAIAVMQNPLAYNSKASRLLKVYPWLKVNGFYEITPQETDRLKSSFGDFQTLLTNFVSEQSGRGLEHKETGITKIKSASNDEVYNALNKWYNYVLEFIENQKIEIPSYSFTNYYKYVDLDRDSDFTKFIEIVNDTNEGLFINSNKNLLPNSKLLPEFKKQSETQPQAILLPPSPPRTIKIKSLPQLPPDNRETNFTEEEKIYLRKLYEFSVNLAYDLRNFMGHQNLEPENHTVRDFKLNNGGGHTSYFLHINTQQGLLYQKLYRIAGRDYKKFYEEFGNKSSEEEKWNFIFTTLDDTSKGSKTPALAKSNETDDKSVEDSIAKYLEIQPASGKFIPLIFTLLPKILKGEDYLSTSHAQQHPNKKGLIIDKEVIHKIRKTFKEAINSLNLMQGGKKTHKLKIKKRKTHRKKLLRHKSRNTINRLKLVRQ